MNAGCAITDDNEHMSESFSPSQRAVTIASAAGLASFFLVFWLVQPRLQSIGATSLEWPICAIAGVAAMFTVLYRSGWHREIAGLSRTGAALGMACSILAFEAAALLILASVAVLLVMTAAFGVSSEMWEGGWHP